VNGVGPLAPHTPRQTDDCADSPCRRAIAWGTTYSRSGVQYTVLLICGLAAGTGTTGTLYEPGETPPSYSGAPTTAAPYVWVCDTFYQVNSGGQQLETDNGSIQVAFDRPTVRGFERRERAVTTAKSHIRRQFNRIGIDTEPEFHVDTPQEAGHVPPE
jgi:hypothetical protein